MARFARETIPSESIDLGGYAENISALWNRFQKLRPLSTTTRNDWIEREG
jgi:hypothetical protein